MNRKELLIRRNQGRKYIDQYMECLSKVLSVSLLRSDFLDLDQTDQLQEYFSNTFKDSSKSLHEIYRKEEEGLLMDEIRKIKLNWKEDAYLLTKYSEFCGAVVVSAGNAIENYKAIIELDGDSLNIISRHKKKCLLIDLFEEKGEFFYEVSIW